MRTKRHVSNHWLLLALSMGIILFLLITIASEIKPKPHVNLSLIHDRFQTLPVDDLSTPLNTRFENIGQDASCLNELALNAHTTKSDWEPVRAYLDTQFSDTAGAMELSLRTLLSETPEATTISLCHFAKELYAIRQTSTGEEFAGYDLVQIGNLTSTPTSFILPLGRIVEMRTDIFEDEALFISARQSDATLATWYYFKFSPGQSNLEQVEWCDRWLGGETSPYGAEPTISCKYTYAF